MKINAEKIRTAIIKSGIQDDVFMQRFGVHPWTLIDQCRSGKISMSKFEELLGLVGLDPAEALETKRAYKVTLELMEEDLKRLEVMAATARVTVPELIGDFIGDLTGGEESGGSDERDKAEEWYSRRYMFPGVSLVSCAAECGGLFNLRELVLERDELAADLKGGTLDEEAAKLTAEDLKGIEEELQELYADYVERCKHESERPESFEDSLQEVKRFFDSVPVIE